MIKLILLRVTFIATGILMIATSYAAERREVPEFAEFGNPADSTRMEVHSLVDTFKSTWAAQDTDNHLKLFADDSEWINAYARMFRGTEELGVFLRERLFPNFASAVSQEEIRNARLVSIRYLNDDAAVIHMVTDGSRGPSTIEGELLRRTHIHIVAERIGPETGQRTDSGWQIVHTAIMDARE